MKSVDMPAMPLAITTTTNEHGEQSLDDAYEGLTKREYAAIKFGAAYLSGQISWSNGTDGGVTPSAKEVAEEAVNFADALFDELGKE